MVVDGVILVGLQHGSGFKYLLTSSMTSYTKFYVCCYKLCVYQ